MFDTLCSIESHCNVDCSVLFRLGTLCHSDVMSQHLINGAVTETKWHMRTGKCKCKKM